jgi:hypothetical protein
LWKEKIPSAFEKNYFYFFAGSIMQSGTRPIVMNRNSSSSFSS